MDRKADLVAAVRDRTDVALEAALEQGVASWPLPLPPLRSEDFPIIQPKDREHVVAVGLGLARADPRGLERRLRDNAELMVPYRMSLTEDPLETNTRWLRNRIDELVERIMFAMATEWLAEALDPDAPDTDRWWAAIALLAGLANADRGQPVHQGYHLAESIALAQRPGHWHGEPTVGPHQMSWDPHAQVPRTALLAHSDGVAAAQWLMDRLEGGTEAQRGLLIAWLALFLERPDLVEPLGVGRRIVRLAGEADAPLAARLARSLPRLLESDRAAGEDALAALDARTEVEVRRALSDVLTRLFRRLGEAVVPMLDRFLEDEDQDVLAAASATVRDLGFISSELFIEHLSLLCDHPYVVVRRNAAQAVRAYLELAPEDPADIVVRLAHDSDEVVATRMRELLLRMEEVHPAPFASVATRLLERDSASLDRLWAVLDLRRPERVIAWKAHLRGEGEMPDKLFTDPTEDLDVESGFLDDNLDEDFEDDDVELDAASHDPLVSLAANLPSAGVPSDGDDGLEDDDER